jgi:hypothetical protein
LLTPLWPTKSHFYAALPSQLAIFELSSTKPSDQVDRGRVPVLSILNQKYIRNVTIDLPGIGINEVITGFPEESDMGSYPIFDSAAKMAEHAIRSSVVCFRGRRQTNIGRSGGWGSKCDRAHGVGMPVIYQGQVVNIVDETLEPALDQRSSRLAHFCHRLASPTSYFHRSSARYTPRPYSQVADSSLRLVSAATSCTFSQKFNLVM